ncbi:MULTISPECIES: hypothetical protein [Salipaludibacillus]|nr:hypothetical protein [Salipaludibacillus neizhouensis]
MFTWFNRKCDFCKRKLKKPSKYIDVNDREINVCYQCVPQAERKALRKKN